jgi:hypothetical protein
MQADYTKLISVCCGGGTDRNNRPRAKTEHLMNHICRSGKGRTGNFSFMISLFRISDTDNDGNRYYSNIRVFLKSV